MRPGHAEATEAKTSGDDARAIQGRLARSLCGERLLELRDPEPSPRELVAHAQDHFDPRPLDVEVTPQRASDQHRIDIDEDPIVLSALDQPFVYQAHDQLVIAFDKLDQVGVRKARGRHSCTSSRTGLE
jgi:hypothetical protein